MADAVIPNPNGAFGFGATRPDGTARDDHKFGAASRQVEWRICDEAILEGQAVAHSNTDPIGRCELPDSNGSSANIGVALRDGDVGDLIPVCVQGVCRIRNDTVLNRHVKASGQSTGWWRNSVGSASWTITCVLLEDCVGDQDTLTHAYVNVSHQSV